MPASSEQPTPSLKERGFIVVVVGVGIYIYGVSEEEEDDDDDDYICALLEARAK